MSERTIGTTIGVILFFLFAYGTMALIGATIGVLVTGPGPHNLVGSAIAIFLFASVNGTLRW